VTDTSPLTPLSDDGRMLVEAVRTLARERIAPRAAEVDHTAEFPWDAVELLRENDVFALAFPEEYGGTGTGMPTHLQAVEERSWADATVGLLLAVQGLGGLPVLLDGSEEQRQRYVPLWARGVCIAA
jgi:alkylation response protein AidB-like acyl-CoA dehydrogenase